MMIYDIENKTKLKVIHVQKNQGYYSLFQLSLKPLDISGWFFKNDF